MRLHYNYFAFSSVLIQKKFIESVKTIYLTRKKIKINYFNEATNNHGFLLIDLKTNDGSLKYRKNLDIRLIEFMYTKPTSLEA